MFREVFVMFKSKMWFNLISSLFPTISYNTLVKNFCVSVVYMSISKKQQNFRPIIQSYQFLWVCSIMHLFKLIKFIVDICIVRVLWVIILIILVIVGSSLSRGTTITSRIAAESLAQLLHLTFLIIVIHAKFKVFCEDGMGTHFRAIRFKYFLIDDYV